MMWGDGVDGVRREWDALPGEPGEWFRRFTGYRLIAVRRSVAAAFKREQVRLHEDGGGETSDPVASASKPRKVADKEWYEKAREWRWEERAAAWDRYQVEVEEKVVLEERARVLRRRYALMHKRVQVLDRLAQKLIAMTGDEDKVWVKDVKAIGTGASPERVDLVRFNEGLFKEIREYLADIADELGERVKTTRQVVSGNIDVNGTRDLLLAKLNGFSQELESGAGMDDGER